MAQIENERLCSGQKAPGSPESAAQTASQGVRLSRVSSAEILRGQAELQIDHNGEIYRLRNTRLGKLILTK